MGGSGLQSIGEALRSAREAQGHTLEDASLATRIRAGYLQTLEAEAPENWGKLLGGDVYAKGFLRSYASYLGLDPAPLVDAYRSQTATEAPVGAPPRPVGGALGSRPHLQPNWMVVGGVMAAIVVVLGLVSLFSQQRDDGGAPPVAAPVTTAPPTTQAPTTTAAPTTTTLPPGVHVVLKTDGPSWSEIQVDGEPAFQGTLEPGQERTFSGEQEVQLQLGNAGAVQLTVNGKRLGPAGDPGQVVSYTFPADADPAQVLAEGG